VDAAPGESQNFVLEKQNWALRAFQDYSKCKCLFNQLFSNFNRSGAFYTAPGPVKTQDGDPIPSVWTLLAHLKVGP
jgi:hypothetical protein